ncbi:MAG: Fic family protein [Planctomycetota bacterium]
METESFTASSPGRLEATMFAERYATEQGWDVREVPGYGFVPDPLPPSFDPGEWLSELYPAIVAAERALSLLEGTARRLNNPHLLTGVFAQREAILSSAIENTFASAEDLALLDLSPADLADRNAAQEVANYLRALNYGLKSKLPVCLRLVRQLHRELLSGVARQGVQPGEFRRTQNAIGATHSFGDAKFVPPPPRHVESQLRDLETYLHREDASLPRLVRFALIHYQFETIHPFLDGNGRVGRLLITLLLCEQGQLTKPLVYVSGFFEKRRSEYYERLLRVSTNGEWVAWIAFFLEAIASQSQDAVQRADRLLDLQEEMKTAVTQKQASSLLPILVDALFSYPYVTASRVESLCDCSTQTAWSLIRRLVEKGILREITQRARNKVFEASRITDLIMN